MPDPPSSQTSKVYRDQLSGLSQGTALWYPDPPKELYNNVSIGDVGYLQEGTFVRMFNVMLPWNHSSNKTLGEPEYYESLDCGPFVNTLKHAFNRVDHYSHSVSAKTNTNSMHAMTRDE
jgi:hypothetical protein